MYKSHIVYSLSLTGSGAGAKRIISVAVTQSTMSQLQKPWLIEDSVKRTAAPYARVATSAQVPT